MATEGTKFQVNYKLSDGTLINLYVKATGVELGASSAAPTPAPTVASVAAAFNATPVTQDQPANAGNVCRHGVMAFREGTSSKGPWKGYMCAAPKGATDKCDTIWVR